MRWLDRFVVDSASKANLFTCHTLTLTHTLSPSVSGAGAIGTSNRRTCTSWRVGHSCVQRRTLPLRFCTLDRPRFRCAAVEGCGGGKGGFSCESNPGPLCWVALSFSGCLFSCFPESVCASGVYKYISACVLHKSSSSSSSSSCCTGGTTSATECRNLYVSLDSWAYCLWFASGIADRSTSFRWG